MGQVPVRARHVTSPGVTRIVPMRPVLAMTRPATAVFDSVEVTGEVSAAWTGSQVAAEVRPLPYAERGGVFTVTASGDVIGQADDGSRIVAAVAGTLFALMPVAASGVLFAAAEHRTRMIWMTFAMRPRRGAVLAAKAIVLGGATFGASLAAAVTAFLASQPNLRLHGYRPPVHPDPSLSDPAVLRVLAGTAAVLAAVALLGLGAGALIRRPS